MTDGRVKAARSATEHALERMPIVREVVTGLAGEAFRFPTDVTLFGVQHIMSQTLALCWALNTLGLSYERIALCGKAYSYCPEAAQHLESLGATIQPQRRYQLDLSQTEQLLQDLHKLASGLQRTGVSRLLVLDDGGRALTHLRDLFPHGVRGAGVEQTASGFMQTGMRSVSIPVVDVGSSAVKRLCEPEMIIDAALTRARRVLADRPEVSHVGIIGLGYIGTALARALGPLGYSLCLFDIRPEAGYPGIGPPRAKDPFEVIEQSEIVFGCTGMDVTADFVTETPRRGLSPASRDFVSLSSGDDEFYSLKRALLANSKGSRTYAVGRIPDIEGVLWGSTFRLMRNGFPVNFDNGPESVPLEQIQGTMAALIGALCQAQRRHERVVGGQGERLMLDVDFQHWLARRWRQLPSEEPKKPSLRRQRPPSREALTRLSFERTSPESLRGAPAFGRWTRL